MKNHIECHYKDGALVFCTTHNYSRKTAAEILDVFNVLGLVSEIRDKPSNQFGVIGRLKVDYDPFQGEPGKWSDLISELTRNKSFLEERLEAF